MNKKQLAENVIKAVKESGKIYRILDGDKQKPKHIRIDGWGDVWPSTATFKHGKKFYRRNYKELCKKLSVDPAQPKKTRADEMKERIQELEEYCSYLDNRIIQLERFLVV